MKTKLTNADWNQINDSAEAICRGRRPVVVTKPTTSGTAKPAPEPLFPELGRCIKY